jgi:hypothetical protein
MQIDQCRRHLGRRDPGDPGTVETPAVIEHQVEGWRNDAGSDAEQRVQPLAGDRSEKYQRQVQVLGPHDPAALGTGTARRLGGQRSARFVGRPDGEETARCHHVA